MKTKMSKKTRGIAFGAIIAATYVVLTYIASAFGLASGAIQIRLSEMLTILPIFTPYAIPGIAVGCLLANILTGTALMDIIFGALASLLGAVGTYLLRKHPILATAPPIASNSIIVPLVLLYAYHLEGTFWYFSLTVFIGEFITCGIMGYILQKALYKKKVNELF